MRAKRARHIREWAYKEVMKWYGVKRKEDLTALQVTQVGKLYKEGKKQWLTR